MTRQFQVNIPFRMLWDTYLDRFLEYNLNPEIGFDADALDNFSFADFRKIAQLFKDRKRRVTFHGPFIDLSPGSNDPDIRDVTKKRLKQTLEIVPLFEPASIVCHAGYDKTRYGFFREEWMETCLETWSWFGIQLAKEGTKLMLENVYESSPDDIIFLFENLEKDNVGFCLDPGHTFAFGGAPLETWVGQLGKYLGQIHLHDNNGEEDEHLAVGMGSIDFQPVFDMVTSDRENRIIITLEPHDEASLWPGLEFLEKVIPEY